VALGLAVHNLDAGATPSLSTSERSASGAQTVHNGTEGCLLCRRPRSHLPEGTPLERRDPRVCLGIGRPPKTLLVDVGPKRGEDSR
jgi:hypothetical protein